MWKLNTLTCWLPLGSVMANGASLACRSTAAESCGLLEEDPVQVLAADVAEGRGGAACGREPAPGRPGLGHLGLHRAEQAAARTVLGAEVGQHVGEVLGEEVGGRLEVPCRGPHVTLDPLEGVGDHAAELGVGVTLAAGQLPVGAVDRLLAGRAHRLPRRREATRGLVEERGDLGACGLSLRVDGAHLVLQVRGAGGQLLLESGKPGRQLGVDPVASARDHEEGLLHL